MGTLIEWGPQDPTIKAGPIGADAVTLQGPALLLLFSPWVPWVARYKNKKGFGWVTEITSENTIGDNLDIIIFRIDIEGIILL